MSGVAVRYHYKDAKYAETLWEVKDVIRHIRIGRKGTEIIIHVLGAWSGCPEQIRLAHDEDVQKYRKRLKKLLESPPWHKVVVVPVDTFQLTDT